METEHSSKKQRLDKANDDDYEDRMKEALRIIEALEKVPPLLWQKFPEFRPPCIVLGFRQRFESSDEITKYCECDYHELSDEWKADLMVILAASEYNRTTLRDIPEPYRSDEQFLRQAVRLWPRLFPDLPDSLRNNIEFWLTDPKLTPSMVENILITHRNA